MPIKSQAKNEGRKKKASGWDAAIADARRRIRDLKFTIKVYSERRRNLEPWPGDLLQGK
jgi:hypothetical protein